MPKLLIEDLEIAEKIEIENEYNKIQIRITTSTFKELQKENNELSDSDNSLGCSLSSAIACALTKVIGKPITIENNQLSKNGKTIETTYRILEIIETETYFPPIKKEEFLSEPIQIQIRKSFSQNLVSLLLTVIGSILLVQVAFVALNDITVWGKDIVQIFLDSRTGEGMSLGIGMKIIHYFLLGLVSLFSGAFTYIRRRREV